MTTPVRTQKADHRKTEAARGDKRASTNVDPQTVIEALNHDLAGESHIACVFSPEPMEAL
jgi:hypothetical protein